FTVTVQQATDSSSPVGLVNIFDNGSSIAIAGLSPSGSGTAQATSTTAVLTGGAHNITATFVPDDPNAFSGSTKAQFSEQVNQAPTTTTVSGPNTSTFGQSVTLTATVATTDSFAGAPTGTVDFTDVGFGSLGSKTLDGSGQATLSISTLSVGTHSIIA